ncbi:MAG: alpha/beta hydrolase [Reichenbachiella sp.]
MKKVISIISIILFSLVVLFFLGPTPSTPIFTNNLPTITATGESLVTDVANYESQYAVKKDNEAKIIWADSTKSKTPYAILYLHGFGASHEEGAPVHTTIADRYGANLYLARLQDHGTKGDSIFINLTPENYLESAKRALSIAKQLGDSVIIISTSTGSTFALQLATFEPKIAGMILYSPFIALNNLTPKILTGHWGREIAELMSGQVINYERDSLMARYWLESYHVNGYVTLFSVIETLMIPETFTQVTCPIFMGYYYKNEEEQDPVVSVAAMLEMYDQLGTPDNKKIKMAFPEAGDHVMASYVKSEDVPHVIEETINFLENTMNLTANSAN